MRGDHGGDALEPVGRECPTEAEAAVDACAGGEVAVVPEEALRP